MRIERCVACGYEGGYIGDPALPPPLVPIIDDDRDAVLVLDSSGANLKSVAAVLKSRLEITSSVALAIARTGKGVLATRPTARVWQLEAIEVLIHEAGGIAHLERVE
jgi:hypothetical protein